VRVSLSYDRATGVETVGSGSVTSAPLSLTDYDTLRVLPPNSAVRSLAAEGTQPMTVSAGAEPVNVSAAFATGDFFATLGTAPAAGRLFTPADDVSDAAPVVVVTDHFWRTHLDARHDAIGSQILIAGLPFRVIGVTPPRFHGLQVLDIGADDSQGHQLWVPLHFARRWTNAAAPDEPWLGGVGRLLPGRVIADARAQFDAAAGALAAASPVERAHAAAVVRGYGFTVADAPIGLLIAVVGVLVLPLTVLAIGCANVANLQLARAAERARELAIRLSIGASRGQIVRLLTLETLMRTLTAVALAVAILQASLGYTRGLFPMDLTVDWRAALFALTLAFGTAIGTGLLPAWLVLRRTAAHQLKQDTRGSGLGHSKLRSGLVIAQVALSLAMLSVSAVFARTIQHMLASAPVALQEQVVATFDPAELGLSPTDARQFADTLAARAAADPRVSGTSIAVSGRARFGAPGAERSHDTLAAFVAASPSWLDVMDVPVLTGHGITSDTGVDEVVVSRYAAETIAPEGQALGATIRVDLGRGELEQLRVVGVVEDNQTRPARERPEPVLYVRLSGTIDQAFTLRVRSSAPSAIEADLRRIVSGVDPRIAWVSLRRGHYMFEQDAQEMSYAALTIGTCGLIALALSVTGLFAVVAYVVTLRRREIGVRVAVGATSIGIVRLILRHAMFLAIAGTLAGLAIALPIAMTMSATFVERVNALDPYVYGPPAALLLLTSLAAATIPALRAARIDPIRTLRED
jgi:predicted permease